MTFTSQLMTEIISVLVHSKQGPSAKSSSFLLRYYVYMYSKVFYYYTVFYSV